MISNVLNVINLLHFLSSFYLSIAISGLSPSSLMASCDDEIIEEDKSSLKCPRGANNNEGRVTSLKYPRIDLETDYVFEDSRKYLNRISEDPRCMAEILAPYFMDLTFEDIRKGRCVSKLWNGILASDHICNGWGGHFAPSTPDVMKMTPQEFIRYYSKPSD